MKFMVSILTKMGLKNNITTKSIDKYHKKDYLIIQHTQEYVNFISD